MNQFFKNAVEVFFFSFMESINTIRMILRTDIRSAGLCVYIRDLI
jgi:hypothetical protein